MKIIKNPTDKDINVSKIFGLPYSVEANGEVMVPDEVANYWQGLHNFLIISDVKSEKVEEVLSEYDSEEISEEESVEKEETPVEVTKKSIKVYKKK
jgi:hypothetical protein